MDKYALGIDLGGTAIKYAVISRDGEIVYSNTVPTPCSDGADGVIDSIAASIEDAKTWVSDNNIQLAGVGIGTPGIVSNDGRIVIGGAENIPGWERLDLAGRLEILSGLPVMITNDANAMALGEHAFGAAKGVDDVIFVTVGTGIGGAALINGKMWRGAEGRGMEVGHITVKADGEPCACGGRGCLEHYASTAALVRRYNELTGFKADGRTIVKLYLEGDDIARKVMEDHWTFLGHGIASVINIFSPRLVVVGGGISEAGSFYMENLKKSVSLQVMKDCAANTEIVAACLGNKAGCLGASQLIFQDI